MTRVAITVVTYNSARYITGCLECALLQDVEADIVVVDNASADGTKEILRSFADRVRIFYNPINTGFAAAQNQAFAAAPGADWFLTLNPDVRMQAGFVSALIAAGGRDPVIGSVCGKLLSASPDFERGNPAHIDSTGICFTPGFRHFDRGNGAIDRGQYQRGEYVFGGTGAACLYRRAMVESVSIDGEFFDSDFFAYREDADVAWRAQLLGWKCWYEPEAIGLHVRAVTPEKRRDLSALINMHSVKNRWLMRIKNTTAGLYRRYWLPMLARDLVVVGGCLLREPSSLPAFSRLWRLRGRALQKRREIMARRRADDFYMAEWFSGRAC